MKERPAIPETMTERPAIEMSMQTMLPPLDLKGKFSNGFEEINDIEKSQDKLEHDRGFY